MAMFDTYDNLDKNYIPNNTTTDKHSQYSTVDTKLPKRICNVYKEFIGYAWDKQETFSWTLSVDDVIKVESSSLILDQEGQIPTEPGIENQKAYNIVDSKSWTCLKTDSTSYGWIEDSELKYPTDGKKVITVHPDMDNKHIDLELYNFRWESIYTQNGAVGSSTIALEVDTKLSELLASGIYYITLSICSEDEKTVKSTFMICIK